MNILRKISIKYLLLVPVLFALSCGESFLDLEPQQSLSTDAALVTIDDMKAAVTGVYDEMQSPTTYGRYFVLVPDVQSDDVKQNASANRAREFAEYNQDATHGTAEGAWANLYQIIDRTNRVIHNTIDVPSTAQDTYDQLLGEAYALRALAHFDLVRLFSQHYTYTADASHQGVPIVTEVDPLAMPSANTVDEVYTRVINDFTTAIPLLVVDPSSITFMSQLAAKALLSRVYLYMEDYPNCITLSNDVINSGPSLMDSAAYSTEWAEIIHPLSEGIFEIGMTETDRNGSDALGGMYNGTGYGDYLPATDLLVLFPAGDVRGDIFVEDLSIGGGVYGTTRVAKYPDNLGRNYTKVIRMAEIYLNLAEAEFMQNGGSAIVDGLLNDLLDNRYPAHPVVAGAVLDDILLQRRLELCFEGDRLWTLMRHKMDMVRIVDCTALGACTITYPNDRFIFPVPQRELDVNLNMTQTGTTY